ncbi:MAG UNVERIFIED_CONTAM: FAD-dependent oxidoreductase [Anaerolineae bacterium]|jgi:pyruvate/2-oxoglutarate dehydrogenase complex dihydrolipoamide dehydrogenase (E3) component
MNPQKYDAILIGTGQAAGTLIAGLLKKDWKIAIVEGAKIGGTCVNDGCSPTKTLVASARAAHVARRGADFGVNIDHFSIDFAKVMERVNHIRTSFSGGLKVGSAPTPTSPCTATSPSLNRLRWCAWG